MTKVFSCSPRRNNLTKTIAQINDCLFIYIKFKAMNHALQRHPHFVRRKEWFVCACGVLHYYGKFHPKAVKHIKLSNIFCTLCRFTF